MERRITIEVSYEGALPEVLLGYLTNRTDALIERRRPLVIRTGEIDLLSAIIRITHDSSLPITAVKYRRAAAAALPAIA